MSRLFAALVLSAVVSYSEAALIATNISGTDGSGSFLNADDTPMVVSNIQNIAPSQPDPPGDYDVRGGWNFTADATIGDRYFQSGATIAFTASGTDIDPDTGVPDHFALLLEATTSGLSGADPLAWEYRIVTDNDSFGYDIAPLANVNQSGSSLSVAGLDLSIAGLVQAGDKVVVTQSGVTEWALLSFADVNGDGVSHRSLNLTLEAFGASNNTFFNNKLLTFYIWEIAGGEFELGSFDATFTNLINDNSWPNGDRFDVVSAPVPVPAAVWLFGSALGLLPWLRRKAGRI